MKLNEWLCKEPGRAKALAEHLGITKGRMSQIATDGRVPQRHMRGTNEFTNGDVTFEEMVPVPEDEAKA